MAYATKDISDGTEHILCEFNVDERKGKKIMFKFKNNRCVKIRVYYSIKDIFYMQDISGHWPSPRTEVKMSIHCRGLKMRITAQIDYQLEMQMSGRRPKKANITSTWY